LLLLLLESCCLLSRQGSGTLILPGLQLEQLLYHSTHQRHNMLLPQLEAGSQQLNKLLSCCLSQQFGLVIQGPAHDLPASDQSRHWRLIRLSLQQALQEGAELHWYVRKQRQGLAKQLQGVLMQRLQDPQGNADITADGMC
jgi:hypothetical protein